MQWEGRVKRGQSENVSKEVPEKERVMDCGYCF